ncbi:proprotein convertase subtilisin/kexin type 5b [Chanos chanos]|uniref:Proprotein convertase subtilisin/kexin type 5b n=1 Tax=Chanos chanos TaxID=29144 RepID=A0A6J2UPM3_CHACN|nr:proprotein convertase subtilisin/kexin type 5 [Chanos chanos]
MILNGALRGGLLCVLALWLGFTSPPCKARIYTNHWAVRITGGPEFADRIASKYGYKNMGQIGDLKDYYHFYHSRTIKRSTISSRGTQSFISMEPKVEWIQQQVVKRRIKRDYKPMAPLSGAAQSGSTQSIYFNDAKWTSMWYIHCNDNIHNCQSDMNVVGAWKRGYTGKDVVVTILDDGIERNHPDLIQNYDTHASYDVNGNDMDPMPRYDASNENKHGTRCAGEVAASANNSHCTVGIAYNAKIGGVRMLDGDVTDMVEAKSLSLHPQHIDIYSASWGPDDDGKTVDGPAALARQAFENGIRQGRKGRGSIFVWASGNGGRSRDHCSCDGYTNSIYTISISSTAESGRKPWYLEECSSTLTTTYSSGENYDRKIITTDLRQRCTDSHTGTSASAPMAAGIIALALEANPLLTWRDVQHIIVKTSRPGHLSAPDWKTNAAGYNVSHLYGFGLMDAEAMVKEAERWKQVPAQHICVESPDRQIRTIRPEHVVRSVYKATGCTDNPNHHVIYLEHVVVRITITHPRRGDLSINLTSPSGTKSQLLANRLFDHSMEGFKNWEFMTTHCWGEKAAGDWILEIHDSPSQLRSQKAPGKLKEWSLVLYGTSVHPYSFRSDKPRSVVEPQTDDEFSDEYNGPCDPECNESGCEGPGPQQCLTCLHYFLKFKNNTRTCVSECPSGFFRDDKKRCKKCSALCESCVGSRNDQCSSCRPGFYLREGSNTCVPACGDGFYLDLDSRMCKKCSESCKKCTASNICTECKPGLSLQGNKCQMTCESGTYYNGHKRICEQCHTACATCAGTGMEACISCAEGFYMEEWRCVSSCSVGYYMAEQVLEKGKVHKSCRKCDPTCYSCIGPGEKNCSTCVSGYNLEGGVCVVSTICKDGQYQTRYDKCKWCDATCYKCSGPEEEDCLSCGLHRVFDDGRCRIHCERGKFDMDGQCHLCHHTCKECDDQGPDDCSSCDADKFGVERYLFNGQCRETCPEGHFHSGRRTCDPCPENCLVCDSSVRCIHCNASYYPKDGKCLKLECGIGEVADPDHEECLTCEEGCHKCLQINPEHCMSCLPEFYKLGSSCHRSCPEKTYEDREEMMCMHCEENCLNCDSSQCYFCEEGYYLSDEKCVKTCPEGFYGDSHQECEPCHRDCRTCGGPDYNDCDSCEQGMRLVNGQCVDVKITVTCSSDHFVNRQGECDQCHPSCGTCSGPEATSCDTCKTGHFLTVSQSCVDKCPSRTFGNLTSKHCEACLPGCVQCQDAHSCQRCQSGHAHLYLEGGRCVAECKRGFPVKGVCQSCAQGCASCEGDANRCLTCESGFVLFKHTCVEHCPVGHYINKEMCERCPSGCKECGSDGTCSACEQYFFLHGEHCLDDCPKGFFASEAQWRCEPCHSDCASCDGPDADDCDICKNHRAVRYNGQCLSTCPATTYLQKDKAECRDCDKSCLTCSGPHPSSCLSCRFDMRLDVNGHCAFYINCAEHMYKDKNGECRACHHTCHRCSGGGKNQCLSCPPKSFLLNQTCVGQCPSGFHGDVEEWRCSQCHETCASCREHHSMDCDTCRPNLFKLDYRCVENCGSSSSRTCEPCDHACKECSGWSDSHCTSCRDGYFLHKASGRCLHECPPEHFPNTRDRICQRCHPTCQTCTDSGAVFCTSCYKGFRLFGGICSSDCLSGTYMTSESPVLQCSPCDSSCMECKGPGPQNCTACPALEVLSEDGQCLTCCGEDTRMDGSPLPWYCCRCDETRGKSGSPHAFTQCVDVAGVSVESPDFPFSLPLPDECVLSTNYVFSHPEEIPGGNGALFAVTAVFMLTGLGAAVFFLMWARSRLAAVPATKPGGYRQIDGGNAGAVAGNSIHDEMMADYSDKDEDEEEDEDIVYMGMDGTVYRKFKYGLLEDEEEELELEYDDESYSFR